MLRDVRWDAGFSLENDRHYRLLSQAEIGVLRDGDLELRLVRSAPARRDERWAAMHEFEMVDCTTQSSAGRISLRLADTPELLLHGGHIGYAVDEEFRGRRYAARAVRLLLPIARRAGMEELWITCEPDNIPSMRSIEIAGGELVEVREIAPGSPLYLRGERLVARYRFDLGDALEDHVHQ